MWYQRLAAEAYGRLEAAWKLRPKLHYFGHTILELTDTLENPARQALWAAEDLVGQAKKLGRLCHKRTVGTRVAQRRGLFLFLRSRRASNVVKKTTLKKKPHN